MIRPALALMIAGFALAVVPASAQTTTQQHTRKASKQRKPVAPVPAAPRIGGINTPSTDFSKVQRADEEPSGPYGPSLRPAMGAGGMGVGGAF